MKIAVLFVVFFLAIDMITFDVQFRTPDKQPYPIAHAGERFYFNIDVDMPPQLAADAYVDFTIDQRLAVELPNGDANCIMVNGNPHHQHCTPAFGKYMRSIWIYATVPRGLWNVDQFSISVVTPNITSTRWLAYEPPRNRFFLPMVR